MKRIAFFAGVLAIAASCSVKEMETATVPAPSMYGYTEDDQTTKTAITVDGEGVGTIWWKPADEINVFYETTRVKYHSTNVEDATTVVFETNDMIGSTESASTNKWGLYPYNSAATCDGSSVTTTIPAAQQCVPETFGNNLFPMIAHSATNELHFKNVCGGIKFSLSRDDIQSITFKGNNNENIVGQVRLSLDGEDCPVATVVAGEKTITLTPSTGTTFASGTNYYLIMLPKVLSSGFTMTFESETEIGTFEYTAKSIEIKRSIFARKAGIDTYATFVAKSIQPEMVDLGLSVKWATCNVGATKPEEYGDYFAWGELEPYYEDGYASSTQPVWKSGKTSGYDWSSYKFCNGTTESMSKYTLTEYCATVDGKTMLDLEDDVANGRFGNMWRIPTKEEYEELLSNCRHEWRTINGIKGYVFTSKVTGFTDKWIFLPATGNRGQASLNGQGIMGGYWTSTLKGDLTAYTFYEDSGLPMLTWFDRCNGRSIRPVYGERLEAINLSEDGTANCYIVNEYGPCKFDATKKGHTNESVGTIASAEVLWESFGTDVQPEVGDIVKDVTVKNGIVSFTASGKDGNAVIAVKDAAGDILWSWHIWVCKDFDPAATAQVYYNNAGTVMDRNLGATSAAKGDIKALGLLYQWGRKDPFLGSSSISSNTKAKSTITWPSTVSSNSNNGTIDFVVKHPTTFVTDNSSNYDWYYIGSSSTDNTRWNSSKGMYDPCPKGWRVPNGGSNGLWAKAFAMSGYWSISSNWDLTNKGMNFGSTNKKLGSGEIWYPASGILLSTAGTLGNVGDLGYYWSCTPSGSDAYSLYFDHNGTVGSSVNRIRAYGQSVRCVKQ